MVFFVLVFKIAEYFHSKDVVFACYNADIVHNICYFLLEIDSELVSGVHLNFSQNMGNC